MNKLINIGKVKVTSLIIDTKEFVLGEVDLKLIKNTDGQISIVLDGINPSPFGKQQLNGIIRLAEEQNKVFRFNTDIF